MFHRNNLNYAFYFSVTNINVFIHIYKQIIIVANVTLKLLVRPNYQSSPTLKALFILVLIAYSMLI